MLLPMPARPAAKIAPMRAQRTRRGFTTIELVVVIVILGILAVAVLPRLSDSDALRAAGFHDEVVAALRYAQKTAVSHRRLVCATVAPTTVTLTIAAANGAGACSAATLNGPDGNPAFARSLDAAAALSASPAGPIYFQPSGAASSDGAGTAVRDFVLTVTNTPQIVLTGATGHVE